MDITAILKRCAGLWAFQIVLHLSMTLKEKVTQHINKIYCSKCNKYICGNKRIDFANNKVKKYISSCCKAKLIIK